MNIEEIADAICPIITDYNNKLEYKTAEEFTEAVMTALKDSDRVIEYLYTTENITRNIPAVLDSVIDVLTKTGPMYKWGAFAECIKAAKVRAEEINRLKALYT